jgi:S-adenosylmethionine:tRNA ribosyltransferase-isomerase
MAVPSDDDVAAYDYDLPAARIAQRPLAERADSRLMVLRPGMDPAHHRFRELPDLLEPGTVLVRNVTRVLPARLYGRRRSGGKTELLLVRDLGEGRWECLGRPASHLKEGKPILFGEEDELVARVEEKRGAGRLRVVFEPAQPERLRELIHRIGQTPLPPYIERDGGPDSEDLARYQTVFAREEGAVAAPTAGLHFDEALFDRLRQRGVEIVDLVLHVGPGTFRPVKAERFSAHPMDAEPYQIPQETASTIAAAKREGRPVIAVGTTVTRALEAAAGDGGVRAGAGETDLFIRPPFRFKVIDGLVTNFHLPRSTLLALVSAVGGRQRVLTAYQEAIREGYRFYSYGDAMLVFVSDEAGEEA